MLLYNILFSKLLKFSTSEESSKVPIDSQLLAACFEDAMQQTMDWRLAC